MLASDLNNPEFAGARNPDDILHVEFYDHAALDTWETNKTGVKTYLKECPYVRISVPGNQLSVTEVPADNTHVQRFPKQWLQYQMRTGKIANPENVPGWQIDEWDEVTEEQIRSLKFLRFYTVEQIAGANDVQIQGIGMGGQGLRERAKKALAERNSHLVRKEVAQRDEKIQALQQQNQELNDKLNLILERLAPTAIAQESTAESDKPRRGRPPSIPKDGVE